MIETGTPIICGASLEEIKDIICERSEKLKQWFEIVSPIFTSLRFSVSFSVFQGFHFDISYDRYQEYENFKIYIDLPSEDADEHEYPISEIILNNPTIFSKEISFDLDKTSLVVETKEALT